MGFSAEVIREESFDPHFKVRFSYTDGIVKIDKGYAQVIRKAPKIKIIYDEDTEAKIQEYDRTKLELEILNVIVNHLINAGDRYYNKKRK